MSVVEIPEAAVHWKHSEAAKDPIRAFRIMHWETADPLLAFRVSAGIVHEPNEHKSLTREIDEEIVDHMREQILRSYRRREWTLLVIDITHFPFVACYIDSRDLRKEVKQEDVSSRAAEILRIWKRCNRAVGDKSPPGGQLIPEEKLEVAFVTVNKKNGMGDISIYPLARSRAAEPENLPPKVPDVRKSTHWRL